MQGYEANYSPNYNIDRDPRPSKSDPVSMLRGQCGAASVFYSLRYSITGGLAGTGGNEHVRGVYGPASATVPLSPKLVTNVNSRKLCLDVPC